MNRLYKFCDFFPFCKDIRIKRVTICCISWLFRHRVRVDNDFWNINIYKGNNTKANFNTFPKLRVSVVVDYAGIIKNLRKSNCIVKKASKSNVQTNESFLCYAFILFFPQPHDSNTLYSVHCTNIFGRFWKLITNYTLFLHMSYLSCLRKITGRVSPNIFSQERSWTCSSFL